MPVNGPLPQSGDAQDIGADATRCFVARIPRNWRSHSLEGTDDYGLDFQIQTTPNQRATDIFRVQLKGTRSPERSEDGTFISITLKATTVRFYDRIVEPILLVVCDLSADPEPVNCPLYYVWVRDELRRISISELEPTQSYVTLRVPTANRLKSDTDLSSQIDTHNELARAGHALGMTVERTHFGTNIEERIGIVKRVATGIDQRGASFIDALAAPVEQHWIEPLAGSIAWHLREAKSHLNNGLFDRAEEDLERAAQMFPGTELEEGEYWYLSGKCHTSTGANAEASDCFKKAVSISRTGKYLAAYAESELRRRYQESGSQQSFPDLHDLLTSDDPMVLSIKSRVFAAEGKLEEAITTADRIANTERHSARAIAHIMFGKALEAVADCEAGLAVDALPHNSRQALLVVKARSKFALCQAVLATPDGELVPPSGPAGIDGALVKEAWEAIEDALAALRETGWGVNVDLVADIWAATASILGKQAIILSELSAVAKRRPNCLNLQLACEAIAAQCGDFSTALEANERLPKSDMSILRRTLMLHESGRHGDCCRWFERHFEKLDRGHEFFGPATTSAVLSAHRLAKPELVKKWASELESNAHLSAHAAVLQYLIATQTNSLGKDTALEQLVKRYEELSQPFFLSVVLLQELDPTIEAQAKLCIQVAEHIRQKVEPSPTMAAHVGMALATLRSWELLLDWCNALKARNDALPKMQAFEALALDRLGRTHEALKLLEDMLAGGLLDSLALNTYINIMVRCGYVPEAIEAAEKIMETADDTRRKKDCIRLLFNLIQQSNPGSDRLLALALQMGNLASPDLEVEEGIYIVMFLTATLDARIEPQPSDIEEFRRRSQNFFAKFPNSRIIKQTQVRDDAPGTEILAQLKEIAGFTDERAAFQNMLENQMQSGQTVVPFAWRPRLILSFVGDIAQLWEIAKRSSVDDKKYHLVMLNDSEWSPPSASTLRGRIPLLDLTALLVTFDLGILDAVVDFFGQIAIAKSTLEELADFVNPFSGSVARTKCVALQDALKKHLASIKQPSIIDASDHAQDDERGGEAEERRLESVHRRADRETARLAQLDRTYRLYSDDLAFRIFAAQSDSPDGICTLDVLAALTEVGVISRELHARKVALLCSWRVGIVVRMDVITSLLPASISTAPTAKDAMQKLASEKDLVAVLDAVWDFRSPFDKLLNHAASVARGIADDTVFSGATLAAFLGQWLVKAAMKPDAPSGWLQLLSAVILATAGRPGLTAISAGKLWYAYRLLVEFHYGNRMDEQKEASSFNLLGEKCASMHEVNKVTGEALFSALRRGLTEGTSDDAHFTKGYTDALQRLTIGRK